MVAKTFVWGFILHQSFNSAWQAIRSNPEDSIWQVCQIALAAWSARSQSGFLADLHGVCWNSYDLLFHFVYGPRPNALCLSLQPEWDFDSLCYLQLATRGAATLSKIDFQKLSANSICWLPVYHSLSRVTLAWYPKTHFGLLNTP